jgi:hypothetical protein
MISKYENTTHTPTCNAIQAISLDFIIIYGESKILGEQHTTHPPTCSYNRAICLDFLLLSRESKYWLVKAG